MSMQSYHALFTTKPLAMDECRRSEISNKVEEIVRFPRLAEPYLEVVQVANSKQNPTPTNCGRLTYAICFPSEKRLSLLRSCDFVQEECWVWLVSVGFAMAMTMAAAMAKSLLSVPSPAASPSVSRAALRQGSVAASLGARLPSSSLLGCALPLTHGGNRDQLKYGRTGLIQASSSQTPVNPVQRRLINLLAMAGASFSFLPVDLSSGRQISGFSGLTEVLQARGLGNIARAASSEENGVLEFAKKDNRRLLHVVYRVGDLDKTIKFYTECLGMKLLRKRDITEEKYTNAFLGYGPEDSNFVVELTYNYGVDKYDIGTGFGHFGIAVEDVQKVVDLVKAKGGKVAREPGPVKGGKSIIAFVEDPDGYKFELIQRPATPEPFCQVMLRVGDLDRAVQFYEKAFGMKELRRVDVPGQEYTLAMVGYGDDEMKTTVLELTYNYGKTEYTKGNGYGQIAVGTDDVYKTAEAVNTFGGKIVREPGPLPGLNTKITAVLDPDGWKSVFVDNLDFAKELE